MSKPLAPDAQGTPTRPYLIRALHEWCTDNGFTPYLAVFVDGLVQVPTEHVKNNEIVLNVGFEATTALKLGNDLIEFRARFGGVAREISVPVDHVVAIYARENGQGMAFPMPSEGKPVALDESTTPLPMPLRGLHLARADAKPASAKPPVKTESTDDEPPDPAGPAPARPALKRIK